MRARGCLTIYTKKINAYIMALFIFQFGLMQPFASILNSQLPIAVFTLVLFILMLLNNNFRFKAYIVPWLIILSIYYLLICMSNIENTLFVLTLFFQFLLKGFSGFIFGSLDSNEEELYDAFLKVAVINFIIIGTFPFVSVFDSMNYMRFGYGMVPSVIMFIFAIFNNNTHKKVWVTFALLSLLLTTIYGSRGPLVVLLFLSILLLFFYNKIPTLKKVSAVFITSIGLYLINKFNLIILFLDYIYFELDIRTYALAKIRMMINQGLIESSSGREDIYAGLWTYINQKALTGWGIGASEMLIGGTAHNLFLQILLESGVVGILIWSLIFIYCLYKIKSISYDGQVKTFSIASLVVSVAIGRLLFSSDMWLRPEFWFGLSILINYRHQRSKKVSNISLKSTSLKARTLI
jgi:O-antigen ligase